MGSSFRGPEERFWRLFRESSSGVALLDPAGCIQASNPALARVFAQAPDDLVGLRLLDLVHPLYRETAARSLDEVLDGTRHQARAELGILRQDGTLLWTRLSLYLARARSGEPDYGIAIFEPVPSEQKVLDAIHLLATTDDLTGLSNRRGFFLLAEQQWRLAARNQREMVVLYADLDGLKAINDTFGHREGDTAIRETAGLLREVCRESDIVGRLGGDEFAVLMMEAGEVGVKLLRTRLQEALAARNAAAGHPYPLSLSVGVVLVPGGDARSLEQVLAEADRLMYEEKRQK